MICFNFLAKLSKRDFLDCRIAVTTSFLMIYGVFKEGVVLKIYLETLTGDDAVSDPYSNSDANKFSHLFWIVLLKEVLS